MTTKPLDEHFAECQHKAVILESKLIGMGGLLKSFRPDIEVTHETYIGIGEMILDLADVANEIQIALDNATISRIENAK